MRHVVVNGTVEVAADFGVEFTRPIMSPLRAVLLEIYTYISIVLAIGMCLVVLYLVVKKDDDREKEEAAREYFDQHGHWPDEA